MRIIGSAFVATTLLVTNAFAATESVAPQVAPVAAQSSVGALAPGKPAGIQKAQGLDNTVWWVLGAGILVGGIIVIATESNADITPLPGGSGTNLTQ